MLKKDVKTVNSSSYIDYIQDKNSEFNASDILHSSTLLRSSKDGNQGNKQGPFWSKLTLINDSNKTRTLILYNPLAGTNYIDVYLYQKGNLKKRLLLGDMREQKNKAFLNRYSAFELLLSPQEQITIVSKIDNFTIVYIGWVIKDTKVFIEEESKFLILFSLVAGIFVFFILVSFIYYLLHKKIIYLILSFHIIGTFLYQFSVQGILYSFDIGVNLKFNTFIPWAFAQLTSITLLLFAYYFFEMKDKYIKSSYFLKLIILLNLLVVLTTVYALLIDEKYFIIVTIIALGVIMMSIIFLILIGLYMKEVGSKYYLLGQTIMLFAMIINILGLVHILEFQNYFRYLSTFSVLIDIVLLFIAQSLKTQKHLNELYKAKIMLIEQSRFASMGQAIGHITHQWKHPLTLLGTSLTLIETILRHDKKNTLMHLEKELPSMTHSIEHMKKTMMELSHYYSGKLERIAFSPRTTINNSISLLSAKSTLKNTKITMDIAEDLEIFNYEHIFSNIVIVLIDNSLDEFNSQNDNRIHLSVTNDKEKHILIYNDNAGGIKIEPIEKVFEYFVSSKGEEEGHGIGLAMVKMLVEERLEGKISVKNSENGVMFEISFKI